MLHRYHKFSITLSESKKKENDNFDAYWRAKIAPLLGSLNMELENVDTLKQVRIFIIPSHFCF